LRYTIHNEGVTKVKTHILSTQNKNKHPFNGAKPGGWGWTNYSGSVPDADDTAGAVLALLDMYDGSPEETASIINACIWLEDLQNSDGGFPTFCKGWGRLPFDSSSADLTGHALLALTGTLSRLKKEIPVQLQRRFERSVKKAVGFLKKHQADDGHWVPLWFGNQLTGNNKNPIYGTTRVCVYMDDCLKYDSLNTDMSGILTKMIASARAFILTQQNPDGSWGGEKGIPGTIEETSLAISALALSQNDACMKGLDWLKDRTAEDNFNPSPIGLYFAMLWYDEKMYPLVLYIEALRRFLRR